MPMTDLDLFSYIAVLLGSALGGVTISRYSGGFGLPKPWLVGPLIAGLIICGMIYFQVTSAARWPLLGSAFTGVLLSVPIAWSRLRNGRPEKW